MSKKLLPLISLLLIAAFVLTACQPKAATEAPVVEPTAVPVEPTAVPVEPTTAPEPPADDRGGTIPPDDKRKRGNSYRRIEQGDGEACRGQDIGRAGEIPILLMLPDHPPDQRLPHFPPDTPVSKPGYVDQQHRKGAGDQDQ